VSAVDELLDALPAWVLVGGKGGVGKTTTATALAARNGAQGFRTLLLSTDPAAGLSDALGIRLTGTPAAVAGCDALAAMQLDPQGARDAFLARARELLVTILDRGTYLDRADVAGLIDAALPGLDETMALLTLLELDEGPWDRVVLDTAPSGHTLRMLALPRGFRAVVALLEAMQAKHRFVVEALTHRYRADAADRLLEDLTRRTEALERRLADPARFAAVLVVRPEPLVVEESRRYVAALEALGVTVRAVIANAVPVGPSDGAPAAALEALAARVPHARWFHVPRVEPPPQGLAAIEQWGLAVRVGSAAGSLGAGGRARAGRPRAAGAGMEPTGGAGDPLAVLRPLTIVAGKGGVGKTTVACALGVVSATPGRPVLVVSTDPAPSVADAIGCTVGDEHLPIPGVPGLYAQQLDAEAAFARFRDRFAARVDAMFDELLPGTLDATHDRRIARDLLALTPPGIDELYALSTLGEVLAAGRFATIIVDPAPTGHLLRLLELPDAALEWTHRLLRLMLKYNEVGRLGEVAQELLGFARHTRALAAMLCDEGRAGAVMVAIDEPVVREQTVRLAERLGALGLAVRALVWNRSVRPPPPLPATVAPAQFEAAELVPPPTGVVRLRAWMQAWGLVPLCADA
jgi:arsenite-transporting ATPase